MSLPKNSACNIFGMDRAWQFFRSLWLVSSKERKRCFSKGKSYSLYITTEGSLSISFIVELGDVDSGRWNIFACLVNSVLTRMAHKLVLEDVLRLNIEKPIGVSTIIFVRRHRTLSLTSTLSLVAMLVLANVEELFRGNMVANVSLKTFIFFTNNIEVFGKARRKIIVQAYNDHSIWEVIA